MKSLTLVSIFVLSTFFPQTSSTECSRRSYATGIVCVCNVTFCDTLEFSNPDAGEVLILSTSKRGLRFKESFAKFGSDRLKIFDYKTQKQFFFNENASVFIDHSKSYQKIVGFGNAFTGAVSFNLNLAPQELQEHIYRSYYSKDVGIGFNMMRIPIGGCDFDTEPWAYNEQPENDLKLSNFTSLDPRDVKKIEQIKNLMKVSDNSDINFVGSAWSSPKWMKTNNDWTGFSALLDEYYQTWAEYHVKYLELMKESGINFWAITTGNEPLNGVAAFLFIKFMSLGWLPRAQGKWVGENLGPSLRRSPTVSNVKILAGDDQRYTFPWWFDRMYEANPQSKNFVDGHAVHWYWDKYASPNLLDQSHQKYPEKLIIATEACSGDKPWEEHKPMLGYWPRCEDYIIDIITDLNHYVNAWIDWNMILDENGGPNYAKNFVDSAMVFNATSRNEVYKQPMFYALGHVSRFIPPESVRLFSSSSIRFIHATAFIRLDGYTAVILYNSANYDVNIDIKDSINGVLKLTIPPKSIHSILFK